MILQSPGFVRSRDKLNIIYLHLQNTHGYQTRQSADLSADLPLKPNEPLIT